MYYTVQNCCTEAIEVVLLPWGYRPGTILGLISETDGAGCFKVLYWSNTGTETFANASVRGTFEDCDICQHLYMHDYCPGITQCCNVYTPQVNLTIYGYACDGTWLNNVSIGDGICMAWVFDVNRYNNNGPCCFQITNAESYDIDLNVTLCGGLDLTITLTAFETYSNCVTCVNTSTGHWTYSVCP
jgi:hypothetical protein